MLGVRLAALTLRADLSVTSDEGLELLIGAIFQRRLPEVGVASLHAWSFEGRTRLLFVADIAFCKERQGILLAVSPARFSRGFL